MMMSIKNIMKWFSRNKPAAAVPTTEVPTAERIFARITSRAAGGEFTWRQIFPAAAGSWIDGDRTGAARCRNGVPTNECPFATVLHRDGSGWSFVANVREDQSCGN
jgi:hypothetical protein